ncbi:MAG: hypothetical protein WB716_13460 [Candidatus Acidiferrales bacterium]
MSLPERYGGNIRVQAMPITTGGKSSRRFFAIRFAAKGFLALLLFASCAAGLRAQAIQFKVVNGKTGRPVADVCVGVDMKNLTQPVYIKTDKDGVALLRLTHIDNEVDISYNVELWCGGTGAINPVLKYGDLLQTGTGGDHPSCAYPQSMPNGRWKGTDPLSTKEVLQHGVVSANTCGKAIASPQPGEVILFVRSRTFREKVYDFFNNLD